MLKIIFKTLLLGILVMFVRIALIWSTRTTDYLAESKVKQARLHGPGVDRIVLVGGSGVAYGIDSPALEACTGRRTLNMGLHVGLGLEYMLTEVADGLRPGDLVVLIPEYEHFCGDMAGDGLTLLSMLEANPSAAKYMTDPRQWLRLGEVIAPINNQWEHTMLREMALRFGRKPGPSGAYSVRSFNQAGDFIGHLGLPSQPGMPLYALGTPKAAVFGLVRRFSSKMASGGIECVLVYPSVAQSYWIFNRPAIDRVVAQMSALRVITNPESWVYPDSYFFDTIYHPTRIGRQARTARLCSALTGWLQSDTRRR